MLVDAKLSEAQREVERNRMEVMHMEELANVNFQKAQDLELRMGQMKITHEQSLVTLESRLTAEHQARIADVTRRLENEKREVSSSQSAKTEKIKYFVAQNFSMNLLPRPKSKKKVHRKFLLKAGIVQSDKSRDLFNWSIPALSKILHLDVFIGSSPDGLKYALV